MKRIGCLLIAAVMLLGLAGCTIGVPRSEYEKVVSERDALQAQIDSASFGGDDGYSDGPETDWDSVGRASIILSDHQWQYELVETGGDYVYVKLTNDSGLTCDEIKVTAVFYDGADMVSTDYNYYQVIPDGRTLFFPIEKPSDDYYNLIPYSKVEVSVTAQPDEGYYADCSAEIETTYNRGADGIMIKCRNNGDKAVERVIYQVVYYNNKGGVVTVEETYNDEAIAAGSSQVMSAYEPYDWSVGTLPYDRYEVYLAMAVCEP